MRNDRHFQRISPTTFCDNEEKLSERVHPNIFPIHLKY